MFRLAFQEQLGKVSDVAVFTWALTLGRRHPQLPALE